MDWHKELERSLTGELYSDPAAAAAAQYRPPWGYRGPQWPHNMWGVAAHSGHRPGTQV